MFTYGNKYKITIYGTSHEETMGVIIDGVTPGTKIDEGLIRQDLNKRKPGQLGTTTRLEEDYFVITNGIFNGKTTGAPLHITIKNNNTISKDYSNLINHPRPNHADFVAKIKYNDFNDYRGGGFFSGRLTTLLVVAGSIAKQLLPFSINSQLIQIGTLTNLSEIDNYLKSVQENNDSVGGIIKTNVTNMIIGLGDPYFNKLDAEISKLIMTIPGVRGIVFGDDFHVEQFGSVNNDLIIDATGKTTTNHSGGIVGGISNGNDIVFNTLVKPTSSISAKQETYNLVSAKVEPLIIKGRHDTAFIRRLPVVVECVTAIVLANFM